MQAVIQTGGKQYLVSPKDKLVIEKLTGIAGETLVFDQVLAVVDGDNIKIGKPLISGAKVTGKIVEQSKADKIVVFKYRAKSRYRRKQGHRQQQTVVQIDSIA